MDEETQQDLEMLGEELKEFCRLVGVKSAHMMDIADREDLYRLSKHLQELAKELISSSNSAMMLYTFEAVRE